MAAHVPTMTAHHYILTKGLAMILGQIGILSLVKKILDEEEALCKAACETPKCYNECATKFVEGINSCPCGEGV